MAWTSYAELKKQVDKQGQRLGIAPGTSLADLQDRHKWGWKGAVNLWKDFPEIRDAFAKLPYPRDFSAKSISGQFTAADAIDEMLLTGASHTTPPTYSMHQIFAVAVELGCIESY